MKLKVFSFLAGLPRSGSTLLSTLLNQHPEIYSSPHSAMLEGLWNLRETFVTSDSVALMTRVSSYQEALWTLPQNLYQDIDKEYIIDKNFGWATPGNYELAKKITIQPSVILTYRPVLEVLASFVSKAEKYPEFYLNKVLDETDFYPKHYLSRNDAMAEYLMTGHGLMNSALLGLGHAKLNEKTGNFLFLSYEDLVTKTNESLNKVFKFLYLKPYDVDINNVQNIFNYVDYNKFGIHNFHTVQPKIEKSKTNPEDYFSDYILEKYSNALKPFGL